jgi:hypothetical protein
MYNTKTKQVAVKVMYPSVERLFRTDIQTIRNFCRLGNERAMFGPLLGWWAWRAWGPLWFVVPDLYLCVISHAYNHTQTQQRNRST